MSIERTPSLLERVMGRLDVFVTSVVTSPGAANTKSLAQAPSSSPNSTATSNGGNNNNNSNKKKEVDWVAVGMELVWSLFIATASGYLLMYLSRRFTRGMMNDDEASATSSRKVCARLTKILQKRMAAENNGASAKRGQNVTIPELSYYELQMAEDILDPDELETTFRDIGGLDATKQEIYELAILPLLQPDLFQGRLVQPVKGILLYGRPGTGKTMLAKALAKEARAVFLPLQLSKILSKWVGESNKLVAATFSLAHKLQPAIIFIDELDTFLKSSSDQAAYLDAIKAEFLTLWDGIGTASKSRVLVLGATNKPHLIDPAILRRMPRTFQVPLPNVVGRQAILELLLKDENIESSALSYIPELANRTAGYSGSDLKELCKAAAMVPVQEVTAEFARRRVMGEVTLISAAISAMPEEAQALRPISVPDLLTGLAKVQRTGAAAMKYGRQEASENDGGFYNNDEDDAPAPPGRNSVRVDDNSLRSIIALIRSLSQLSDRNGPDDIPNIG